MVKRYSCLCISCLCSVVFIFVFTNTLNAQTSEEKTEKADTLRERFFLDGNHVYLKEIEEGLKNKKIETARGSLDPMNAIFYYGEKARYGIFLMRTIKKEEEDDTDKE